MNEHDVVRVKETVMVTPNFEDDPIEIKAGWCGAIVAHADKPTPSVEFNERYRGKPFLVDLDAANLEVVPNESDQPNYRWVTHEEMMPMIEKIVAENFEAFKRLTEDEGFKG